MGILVALLLASVALPPGAAAKQKKQTESQTSGPIAWLDLHAGPRDFSVSLSESKKGERTLPRGALLPVISTKQKRGAELAQVAALNFPKGTMELGWVEVDPADLKPAESYPLNSQLLRALGAPYLDDFISAHTNIARFLLRRAQGSPVLLCYVISQPLAMAKLVIFTINQGKYSAGAELSFPLSEMQGGVTSLEIRDLLGDGNECVITKEPFREQVQTYGDNLRIRTIADGQFRVLWQAPIEFQNLSQYSPKIQILQPPEQNIGAPGTVTAGSVTFHASGSRQEPVWKGKVEFFVFGRDKPVDSVNIEKACPWDGKEFAPLK